MLFRKMHHWHRWVLFILSTVVFAISVLLMPFLFERQGEEWLRFSNRTDDPTRPLEVYERFLQFNTDAGHWVLVVSDFPYVYARDQIRINRPVYPAVCSLLARGGSLLTGWPDWRSALTEPTNVIVTFASTLLVNYVIAVSSVQIFFEWLKRHLSIPASFVGSAMLALSSWWLWQANQAATSVVAVGVIVLTIYLFDRLLDERNPTWGQIVGFSFLIGLLMLAKAQYDALFVCWLWAAYRRRWQVLGGTLLLHLLPLLAWIGILRFFGLQYSNYEMSVYRQGVWILDMITQHAWRKLCLNMASIAGTALGNLFQAFSPLTLAMAFWTFIEKQWLSDKIRYLFVTGFGTVVAFLVAIHRPAPYLVFDLFFVIYPLAAIAICRVAQHISVWKRLSKRIAPRVFNVVVLLFFIVNVPLAWYVSVPSKFVWRPALGELVALVRLLTGGNALRLMRLPF